MTLDELVSAMKAEILDLMKDGTIPNQVNTFGELHDYCDANCLGRLCTDTVFDGLVEQFGGRDEHEGIPDGMHSLINEAQNTIQVWLQSRNVELI